MKVRLFSQIFGHKLGRFYLLGFLLFITAAIMAFAGIDYIFYSANEDAKYETGLISKALGADAKELFVVDTTSDKSKVYPQGPDLSSYLYHLDRIYLLHLSDNKSIIRFALGDTLTSGTSYDLSTTMQEVAASGVSDYEFLLTPVTHSGIKVYMVPPQVKGKKVLFVAWAPFNPMFIYGLFSLVVMIGIVFPLFIIIFARTKRSTLLEMMDDFEEQLDHAMAKDDPQALKTLIGDDIPLYKNVARLHQRIHELRKSEKDLKESLQVQVNNFNDLLKPFTEGNFNYPFEVSSGPFQSIADSIKGIVRIARENAAETGESPPAVVADEIPGPIPAAVSEVKPEAPVSSGSPVAEREEISGFSGYLLRSGGYIDLMAAKVDNINTNIPPLFRQLEALYERELNHSLAGANGSINRILITIEDMINEKASIENSLRQIRKALNEILILRNWINTRIGKKPDHKVKVS